MGESLCRSHPGQRCTAPAAERAARCRQDQALHLRRSARPERLSDRGVLGVDGDQLPRCGGALDELPADDQRLLVRERQQGTGLEGGERGPEADRPGDAVQHHIRLDAAHETLGVGGAERGLVHTEPLGLRRKSLDIATRGEADDAEPLRVRRDDVEGLRTDRPGRAEDDYSAHASHRTAGVRDQRAVFRMSMTKTIVSVPLIVPDP